MQCAGGFKTVYVDNAKIINFPKAGRTGTKNCWKVGQAGAARHPENTWVPYTSGIGGSWLELHHQYSSAQHCGEKFPEWVLRLPIRPRVLGMRNGMLRKAQLLSLSVGSVYSWKVCLVTSPNPAPGGHHHSNQGESSWLLGINEEWGNPQWLSPKSTLRMGIS